MGQHEIDERPPWVGWIDERRPWLGRIDEQRSWAGRACASQIDEGGCGWGGLMCGGGWGAPLVEGRCAAALDRGDSAGAAVCDGGRKGTGSREGGARGGWGVLGRRFF
jgi:hypothetical protein